jgi:hypothetical protein
VAPEALACAKDFDRITQLNDPNAPGARLTPLFAAPGGVTKSLSLSRGAGATLTTNEACRAAFAACPEFAELFADPEYRRTKVTSLYNYLAPALTERANGVGCAAPTPGTNLAAVSNISLKFLSNWNMRAPSVYGSWITDSVARGLAKAPLALHALTPRSAAKAGLVSTS